MSTEIPFSGWATEAADEDELPLAFNHLQLHFIRRDRQWLMLSL